jgi:endonuclease YncB( thermonuclease family)
LHQNPIDQGQAIEGRCVEITDGDTIKVLSAGNELIRVPLAFIDTPEKAQAFKKRL